jgi:hypothetical protein
VLASRLDQPFVFGLRPTERIVSVIHRVAPSWSSNFSRELGGCKGNMAGGADVDSRVSCAVVLDKIER